MEERMRITELMRLKQREHQHKIGLKKTKARLAPKNTKESLLDFVIDLKLPSLAQVHDEVVSEP